jgi:histidine triad (HIT) family protein
MTIFERIIQRQIPADIVFEDDEMIAFRDIQPRAPVHILVVPKRLILSANELTESDSALIGRLVLRASEIARMEGVAESGYRLVLNCNRDGGQSVDHLHLHVLGGRQMEWPPG